MYTLFFAPDNASLIIRVALEELDLPYEDRLVDRASREQTSEAYRKLNPNGLIPVLLIDDEPIYETGAIFLYLADRHKALGPDVGDPARPDFLKWLFFISNTIHTDLRHLFYPEQYTGTAPATIKMYREITYEGLQRHWGHMNDHYAALTTPYLYGDRPCIVDIYLGLCIRWAKLYAKGFECDRSFNAFPALKAMIAELEQRPIRAFAMDGISEPCLTAPSFPDGSKGAPQ